MRYCNTGSRLTYSYLLSRRLALGFGLSFGCSGLLLGGGFLSRCFLLGSGLLFSVFSLASRGVDILNLLAKVLTGLLIVLRSGLLLGAAFFLEAGFSLSAAF